MASPVSFISGIAKTTEENLPPLVTAEINVNGVWQKVNIVDKESEYLYKVHYMGLSDSADEWVSLSQIKNIDSAAKPLFLKEGENNSPVSSCSFIPPVSAISNAEKFSEKLAKRKIYEWLVLNRKKDAGKAGVSYLYYQNEEPYTNTVSVSAKNEMLFKNALAPAGAMIYPVRLKYRLCEIIEGKIVSQIIDGSFSCYRNNKGYWECVADNGFKRMEMSIF